MRQIRFGRYMANLDTTISAFDQNAPRYDRHAALEREVGDRLLERLEFRRIEPGVILDLGCGTGHGSAALRRTFRKAQVAAVDISCGMLEQAGRQSSFTRPLRRVNADMTRLPFTRAAADLVHSNLALPWSVNTERLFHEVARVLRPDGLFLFSTFGIGSLSPLVRDSTADGFFDVLELGDALTAAGFREPVIDVDRITLEYRDIHGMIRELEATGSALLVPGWREMRANAEKLASAWPESDGCFPVGFEILYGLAFGPAEGQPRRTRDGEIATFSVDSLLKSRPVGYD
jgi:malonyl-CoA O-methyltransferase